jgi:lysyl endopeptidase
MKKIYTLLFALSLGFSGFAQISHGGRPMALESHRDLVEVNFITMPAVNVAALEAEDAITDQFKDIPYRFGHNIPVNIGMDQWTPQTFEDGSRLMRLGIESPGAVSINLNFSVYDVPAGAQLFVYDADRTHFIGSFTEKNVEAHGGLAISLIFSDRIILEYYEPAKRVGMSQLEIDNITHGYRNLLAPAVADRGPFGNSGSCNINVACPLGLDWQDQIRSVALIVVNGNAQCTGSLVNNTAEDGTPYFLTANHCLGGNVNNWVFYFNHQSANCVGNNGPTNQSVTGASLKASNAGSDFALLQLNTAPPASFDVYFNGWDRNNVAPTSSVGIHHPSGDVKKISFDGNAAVSSVDGGAQTWRILDWDQGTTEGGSSGSPLFNQNGHVVGQLYGGFAACGNDLADWYGKFAVSWDGASASSRLKDWLDPNNSNITVLNGLGGAPLLAFDAALLSINNVDPAICGSTVNPSVTIRNNGTVTLTSLTLSWTLNGTPGNPIEWTGSLATGQQANVNLPALTPGSGNHVLQIVASNPNGQSDGNVNNNTVNTSFTLFAESLEYTLSLTLDNYASETTWEIRNEQNQVIFSGGPYADGANGTVVTETFCVGNGCYTFKIIDSWGDGMCCQWGQGSYTVLDNNGISLFTGGQFTNEASHNFCVTSVSVLEESALQEFKLYPNPAKNQVTIVIPAVVAGNYLLEMTDVTGRIVYSEQRGAEVLNQTVNVDGLSNGLYMVRLSYGSEVAIKSLVIAK